MSAHDLSELLPDEHILFQRRPHVVLVLVPLALLIMAFLAFVLLFCPNAHMLGVDGRCLPLAVWAVVVTGLAVVLDWWLTVYTLTNLRAIRRQGIIGR